MLIVLCTVLSLFIPLGTLMICCSIEIATKKRVPHLIQWVCIAFLCFVAIIMFCEATIIFQARTGNSRKEKKFSNWRQAIEIGASVDGLTPEIIKNIYNYNSMIKVHKYYLNSRWTNWFASPTIANQPLIDINKYKPYTAEA